MTVRTQVGIVGAGPAGLMLGQLLHLHDIDSVIVENRSRQYVVERVRAGVLEQGTVDLMHQVGVGGRLAREGMRHGGIYLAFGGVRHHIDMAELTGGRAITIYGQNEVVHDLIEARVATGRPLHFEAEDVSVHDVETTTPRIRFRTANGDIITVSGQLAAGSKRFAEGTQVPMVYKVSKPTEARVALFTDNWLGATLAAVIGLVGLAGGWLVRRGVRREVAKFRP